MNRRAILKGALGGVLGLTLPPFARSAFSQESPAVVPVSEGFVMLTGAGGNVLVRTASTGQVLVDSGAAESTDAVLKRLRELPGAGRVTTVFNTHWHREQVGGNLAFGRSEATIIAHEKTRAHLATDYYLQDEDRYEKALPAAARPTVTFLPATRPSPATSGSSTATCSRPTPTAISTYSSETRTCWPRVMPSRR